MLQQAQEYALGDEVHDNTVVRNGQDATADTINLANQYSMQGGSRNPCQELTYHGNFCMASPTYPCEKDHGSGAYFICHFCYQNPLLHDANEEEEMIKGFRLYLCEQCTNVRSELPDLQLWEHERRLPGETRVRKMFICSCQEELHINWICRYHRAQRVEEIKVWGREKVRAFTNFNQGRFCADPGCRRNPPKGDGEIVMWNCAACEDLVMAYGNLRKQTLSGYQAMINKICAIDSEPA